MTIDAKRRLSLAAVIAVAAMIFFFSAQPGEDSSKLSGAITDTALTLIMPRYAEMTEAERAPYREQWSFAVRKLAHFLEFALFAVTLSWHLHYTPADDDCRRLMLLAWLIATLYAGTDELHQMFVDARGPSPVDVGIDSFGALTGALCAALALRLRRGRKRSTQIEEFK